MKTSMLAIAALLMTVLTAAPAMANPAPKRPSHAMVGKGHPVAQKTQPPRHRHRAHHRHHGKSRAQRHRR